MNEQKSLKPLDQVKRDLFAMMPKFKSALPPNIVPEKFLSVLMISIQNTPDLLLCDKQSLFNASLRAATDGLLPDGREAAILKYNSKKGPIAQYQPMVGGILKKLRNSGELAMITAQIVHEADKFRYWVDITGEHLEHGPTLFTDRGPRIGAYAIAKTKDGAIYIETMTRAEIMDVRGVSKAKDSGPWAGPFEAEMWKKSVIKRLSKRLPMSTDVVELLRSDDKENYEIPKPISKAEDLTKQLEAYEEADIVTESEDNNKVQASPEFEAFVAATPDPRSMIK